MVLSGISAPFGELFRASRKITHVLLTRAPLYSSLRTFSLDLHVLGTPPAFVLSQDQTLQLRDSTPALLSPSHLGMSPRAKRNVALVYIELLKTQGMRDRIPS